VLEAFAVIIVEIAGVRFECGTPLEAVRVYREHVNKLRSACVDPEKIRRRNQQARAYYRRRKAKAE
jgi:hypothetical protein